MTLLKDTSTRAPEGLDKEKIKDETDLIKQRLKELQSILYAEKKYSLLIVIQGMDASGKDGVIKNGFGGLDPQGISVQAFKAPEREELSHDFLWRIHKYSPAKGMIRIFNRSHYEDVLITRVHGWCDDNTAQKRFNSINDFEALLQEHNNTIVLKFYMHISPEEQNKRLKERMKDPEKVWKHNANDFEEAKLWNQYMEMYQDVFENCNNPQWIIVPADQNWYKEYVITKAVADKLGSLNMQYPTLKESR